jgi:hypothetical protein
MTDVYGFRVWDAAGNIIHDITDRLSRTLGVTTIGTASQTGSVTHAGFADGEPYWICTSTDASNQFFILAPNFSFFGTTLSWDWGTAIPRCNCQLVYGVL